MSRLNFFERERISHTYGRIKVIGKVHRDSRAHLWYQYQAVLSEIGAASNPRQTTQAHAYASPTPAVHHSPPARPASPANNPPAPRPSVPRQDASGAMTLQAFRALYRDLTEEARRQGLTPPQRLSDRAEQYLAANVETRNQAFSNLRRLWRRERGQISDEDDD
jgi:hypothetical protein